MLIHPQITKYNFPRLLKEAWENAMLSSNICAGFRNAGIYPLNEEKVRPTIENDELLTGIYKSVNIIHIQLTIHNYVYILRE